MWKFRGIRRLSPMFVVSNYKRNAGTNVDTMAKSLSNIFATKKDVADLKLVHNEIVNYLTNHHHLNNNPVRQLYKNMIEYNVGQYVSGYAVIGVYKAMVNIEDLNNENIKLANVLGWCYEVLTSFAIMTDDAIDGSTVRRGKPSWYSHKDVGLQAINHAIILENSLYLVLLRYFRNTDICISIMELFHETILTMFSGQAFEGTFLSNGKPQLDLYTLEHFQTLAYLKTGFASIRSSVVLASYLAGKYSEEFDTHAQFLGKKLGPLFQANNDFIGCFDNRNQKDKGDTDVSEAKCTWLVVTALQKATSTQKEIIAKYYGQAGEEAEMALRNLYQELELGNDYQRYQHETLIECFKYVKGIRNKDHRSGFYVLAKLPEYFKYLEQFSNESSGNARSLKLYV